MIHPRLSVSTPVFKIDGQKKTWHKNTRKKCNEEDIWWPFRETIPPKSHVANGS